MPDERTPNGWELQRALADLRQDFRDSVHSINTRFDKVVSAEVFAAFVREYERRVAEVEKDVANFAADRKADAEDRKSESRQRATDRKWLIALALGSVVPLLIQMYQLSKGG